MKIDFQRSYLKSHKKLSSKIQIKVEERILLFSEDRKNLILRDHALTGNMLGKRSFSITGDYRIIYEERQNGEIVFVFLDIGTHAQIY